MTVKGMLVYGRRAETRRQGVALFDLCWECVPQSVKDVTTPHMAASDRER